MKANKHIEAQRLKLGLSEQQLAEALGMSVDAYCDIEWHDDELHKAVELQRVKKLSETLGIPIFELLAMQCPFCSKEAPYLDEYRLPRDELIKLLRQNAGLSQRELGDCSDFHDYAIEGMECDPDYLERSTIESICDLSVALKIPLQVLFGVRCPKCQR